MDNIDKGIIVNQVFNVGKEEARRIIDQVKQTDGDDAAFIAELERLYSEK